MAVAECPACGHTFRTVRGDRVAIARESGEVQIVLFRRKTKPPRQVSCEAHASARRAASQDCGRRDLARRDTRTGRAQCWPRVARFEALRAHRGSHAQTHKKPFEVLKAVGAQRLTFQRIEKRIERCRVVVDRCWTMSFDVA